MLDAFVFNVRAVGRKKESTGWGRGSLFSMCPLYSLCNNRFYTHTWYNWWTKWWCLWPQPTTSHRRNNNHNPYDNILLSLSFSKCIVCNISLFFVFFLRNCFVYSDSVSSYRPPTKNSNPTGCIYKYVSNKQYQICWFPPPKNYNEKVRSRYTENCWPEMDAPSYLQNKPNRLSIHNPIGVDK